MAHLREGPTIADLAAELGTGTAALDHACQSARGKRAIDLMHEVRLQRAVEMLREGGQSPAQIAKELGYTSHTHFTRSFVAATGQRPETFRDQSS
ncbi:AraC family transcriptional regulator [Paracoccus methylarcula]|uniref:AraC family transcriptional regulator n=2 Tax=Paracoccus methylarcula TaxID=72022 RepID=A0A3R7SCB5_9RHOB|nr:AraC family transcriptional regulator [Paracoccus methylarcula]